MYVNLHNHSEFSPLDGLSSIKEIVDVTVAQGVPAVAVTDHGFCSGHPALAREAAKAGLKPVFGMEAYFVNDRFERGMAKPEKTEDGDPDVYAAQITEWEQEQKRRRRYYHLVLWAKSDEGLRNLYAMSSEAHRDGMYYHPRLDWTTLERYHEGVMASTACLGGPVAAHLTGQKWPKDKSVAEANLMRLKSIFGDDLFVELHANGMAVQAPVNIESAMMAMDHGVRMLAVSDSHFPNAEDHHDHQVWIAIQTNSEAGEGDFFADSDNLYMHNEEQVRALLLDHLPPNIVDMAINNTVVVADRAGGTFENVTRTPIYSKQGGHEADAARLLDLCMKAWAKKIKKPTKEHFDRFEREYRMLVDKLFCGYFLYVWDYVKYAKDNGVLVGPGRGSGAGSLVAYLLSITEIEPVGAGLLFERFMTEGRTSLPDFDVDFPTSKRDMMQDYVLDKYGADYVIRVGTHGRLRSKGIIKDLFRALKNQIDVDPAEQFSDSAAISAIIKAAEAGTAGIGLSWEELWEQEGDLLTPYRDKYPMVFAKADALHGRLKTYGKHAAGLVISTFEPLTGTLPLRGGEEEGMMISQFEMADLEAGGNVKYDFLTIRTLDTIQMCLELLAAKGITLTPNEWDEELDDQAVWEQIGLGHTLGIFQIETASGTRLAKEMKPTSLSELSDMITLVRPGPMRSGLTRTYMKRRAGDEPVSVPDPRLEPVLLKTHGTLLYQEDIMAATMVLAGYDSNEADGVRKILGKKQVEKVEAAGKEFTTRAVQHGMNQAAADDLWEQMAEFAKYSFNRAHAWSYAVIAYWCAWLKFHYPTEFLVSVLSTVDKDVIPDFINEARRLGFQVLPPDINISGKGFTGQDQVIRYGLDSLKGVADAALELITGPKRPYTSWDDFKERCSVNSGVLRTLAKVGAFDTLVPNRRGLVEMLAAQHDGTAEACIFKEIGFEGPNNLPCHFDWDNDDPVIIGRTGKPLKQKPLPKKCTKACRNYTAPPAYDMTAVTPYTSREIREIEREEMGVYLSSTPFDDLPEHILEGTKTATQTEAGPEGLYLIAATVARVKEHRDRNDNTMAFVALNARNGELDVVAFSKTFSHYRNLLKPGVLCVAGVQKKWRNGEWSYNLIDLVVPKIKEDA